MCVFVCPARVIGVWNSQVDLIEVCMEETGGLGVDIIIDSGGKQQRLASLYVCVCVTVGVGVYDFVSPAVRLQEETDARRLLPHKHDIITLLGVGGHWVTSEDNLQVDLGCVYYRALVHFEHLLSVLRALTLRNYPNSVH